MVTIDFADMTNATSVDDGTGYFDILMKTINIHIEDQYNKTRLTGTDYATVYLGMMQSALQSALQFTLQKQSSEAQVDSEIAKKALIERQTKGFDDDAKQKLLKQSLDSWSVAYSVAQDENSIPDTIKVNVIDSIMKDAMDSLTITKTNDPLGEV